jgi:glycosyltransferase involved in cell wall biosynthesis
MLPNHIVAVSAHTQRQLREVLHYKGQVSLVSNGIDYKAITAVAAATTESDVAFTGRLIPHKNVNLLIEAIAELRKTRPTIRCVIVGIGPEHQRLKNMIHKLDLGNNVFMTGRLESSNDVYAIMKASKVFVSPSFREGFGITVLEAYACGLPVVTVRHPDNAAQYLVQDGSGIVCEPTALDIASAIAQLLTERKHLNIVDASQYDWSVQAEGLREVYGI